jgi:F0F1-type ATP synthase membrane subunit c/vacuolar-type H+-ATPase subunit K
MNVKPKRLGVGLAVAATTIGAGLGGAALAGAATNGSAPSTTSGTAAATDDPRSG